MRKTTPIKTGKMRGRHWLMKKTGESLKKGCNSKKNKTYRISKIVEALFTFSTRFSIQKTQLVCS
jgi:hypothetical protein